MGTCSAYEGARIEYENRIFTMISYIVLSLMSVKARGIRRYRTVQRLISPPKMPKKQSTAVVLPLPDGTLPPRAGLALNPFNSINHHRFYEARTHPWKGASR